MASRAVDLNALAERATAARESGEFDVARELYTQLEQADPDDPEWPRALSMIFRHTNALDEELNALLRCAERHAARDEFLPALATCKMILSVDPGHGAAQVLMTQLEPDQAVSVDYASGEPEQGPAPPSANDSATSPGMEAAADRSRDGAALDELVLTEIVQGARPSSISSSVLEGVHEIPLDQHGPSRRARTSARPRGGARAPREHDQEIAVQLEENPLFASLGHAALSKLVRRAELVSLATGEVLFRQGDPAGALYIVVRGAVVPIAEEEPRTRLGVLEPGEFFGEIALFTDQPRNATVEALVDTELLAIDRPGMWTLIRKHPEVLSVLLGFLRDRLIDRLVRTSPLFRIFTSSKRSMIAQKFRFLEVADGRAVVEQHHPTEAVFILLAGHMDVVHDPAEPGGTGETTSHDETGPKVLATLGPGELFGEMSLLWREPSLASVVARGKCWLLALSARSFQEMLDHHPQLAAMAATIAEERRSQNQRTLKDALGHRDGKAGII